RPAREPRRISGSVREGRCWRRAVAAMSREKGEIVIFGRAESSGAVISSAARKDASRSSPVTALDSLKSRRSLKVGTRRFDYFSLKAAEKNGLGDLARLPFSLKVLLENLLRNEDGRTVRLEDIKAVARWLKTKRSDREIAFRPARVLMQDFTGVPAVVDLAAMRDAMKSRGEDPRKINPLSAVDLVIDHSVMVDAFGSKVAFAENVAREYERNGERYAFLRWGQKA